MPASDADMVEAVKAEEEEKQPEGGDQPDATPEEVDKVDLAKDDVEAED